MIRRLTGRPLVPGVCAGRSLTTDEALSFWGGLDPHSGRIIDRHHPRCNSVLSGRVLVLPTGRGSCSASGVLLESIQLGTGPAGIIISEVDPIIGLGAILGEELCGIVVPVVLVTEPERRTIPDDVLISIDTSGFIIF